MARRELSEKERKEGREHEDPDPEVWREGETVKPTGKTRTLLILTVLLVFLVLGFSIWAGFGRG